MPAPTVLRSATTTFVTPRCDRAQAAAAPSMPPPTITTSAVLIALGSSRKRSSLLPRNPFGTGQRDTRHRRSFDRDGDQVLGLEMAHMGLSAGSRDGLGLHREHPQVVGQPPAAFDGVEPGCQLGILCADTRGVGAVLEVVEETRS